MELDIYKAPIALKKANEDLDVYLERAKIALLKFQAKKQLAYAIARKTNVSLRIAWAQVTQS